MRHTCAHCGQVCGDYEGGYACITRGGAVIHLCHPNDPDRPDCYHLVTIAGDPLGALKAGAAADG